METEDPVEVLARAFQALAAELQEGGIGVGEWIEAIKTGGTTTCRFDYSGPLTETALLGNVAFRVGKKLEWDFEKLKATNCGEADEFIQHHYRRGWKI